MRVERVSISTLVADPANARTHDAKNLRAIAGSLKKFGQQKPIVVDANGVVVAGNGTLAAAQSIGWEDIDVVRSGLSGTEAIAYAIADNRTGELAAWDDAILTKTLAALTDDGWDLTDIGFDDDDWASGKNSRDDDTETEKDDTIKLTLTITFENDDDQQELFIELRDRGYKVKV